MSRGMRAGSPPRRGGTKPAQPGCYSEIEKTLLARREAACSGVPCRAGRERSGSCLEQRPLIGFVPQFWPRTKLASFRNHAYVGVAAGAAPGQDWLRSAKSHGKRRGSRNDSTRNLWVVARAIALAVTL